MGARGPKPSSLADRLWSRVKRGDVEKCWPWQGYRVVGYGRINVNGKSERAHRVAYALTFGPIPDGVHICHHCDNPPCCNPSHLFQGTARDNALDRKAKGRGRTCRFVGEAHPCAKLSLADAGRILLEFGRGETKAALARRYGVSEKAIYRITSGRGWREDQPESAHRGKAMKENRWSTTQFDRPPMTKPLPEETRPRKLSNAPCDRCGYNGPGYFQPEQHPCATEHHQAVALEVALLLRGAEARRAE